MYKIDFILNASDALVLYIAAYVLNLHYKLVYKAARVPPGRLLFVVLAE